MPSAPEQIIIRVCHKHHLVVTIQIKGIQIGSSYMGQILGKDKKDKAYVRQRQSRLVLQLPPVTVSSAARTRKKGWQCWNWEKNYFSYQVLQSEFISINEMVISIILHFSVKATRQSVFGPCVGLYACGASCLVSGNL